MHLLIGAFFLFFAANAIYVAKIETVYVQEIPKPNKIIYSGKYLFNESFAIDILNQHNIKRKLHGTQSLSWNSTVFEYAAAYAQDYDCSGILTHSGGKYGENLAIGYSTDGSVNAWYDEGGTYKYGLENVYNHFTALIWNSTSQVGCAYKYCSQTWGTYIVCSYYPAGNVIGYSTENVFPPI